MGTDQLIDLDSMVGELADIPCESGMEQRLLKLAPHAADWYARYSCGRVYALCEGRRTWAVKCGSILDDVGCGEVHYYDTIIWTPIQR